MRTAARRQKAALPGRQLPPRFPSRRCRYPPERRPASPGTRMARLPTAARQAVARRTRPTRPRLRACVLVGVRWGADAAPTGAGRDAALPAAGRRSWVPVLETGRPPSDHRGFVTTRDDLLVAAGPSVDPGR